MSGIPYNELQDVNCTVNDTDGTPHVIATLHYAFVIPCRDCRYYASNMNECMRLAECDGSLWFPMEQDDFCSCGERRDA